MQTDFLLENFNINYKQFLGLQKFKWQLRFKTKNN